MRTPLGRFQHFLPGGLFFEATMLEFKGCDSLRDALLADGWRISRRLSSFNRCDWYAWAASQHAQITPHCEFNERPPVLCVEPVEWDDTARHGQHRMAELVLRGQLMGQWWQLRSHGVAYADFMALLPSSIAGLVRAWVAIASVSNPGQFVGPSLPFGPSHGNAPLDAGAQSDRSPLVVLHD